jgi:tRNA nucleotidyltransferase (CCA-adding enzyme)
VPGDHDLTERLRALRGVDVLLPALDGLDPCYLVGGAVRDLLLGSAPVDVDVDVAVEGDAHAVARALAERLQGELRVHDRFGTATVTVGGLEIDLARTRRERYPAPGALPEVEPAGLDEDLGRRDFSINAIAVGLGGEALGSVRDPHRGCEDLQARIVRALHPRSFVDDPTRLLRALRYAARLDFALEAETERLARAAIADGALGTVSGPRVRDELIDLLAEHAAARAVESMGALRLEDALHPGLIADAELVASTKLGAAETGADPALAALAALCSAAPGRLRGWVGRLGLEAAERDAVLRAAQRAPVLVARLGGELRPSELRALLAPEPAEALALALGLGAPAEPVLRHVSRLSAVRLEITGDDLVAAGVPESPAIGYALEQTLARKVDGDLDGREQELEAALALARGRG